MTPSEKKIQERLNAIVIEKRRNGLETKLEYQTFFVAEKRYEDNERGKGLK